MTTDPSMRAMCGRIWLTSTARSKSSRRKTVPSASTCAGTMSTCRFSQVSLPLSRERAQTGASEGSRTDREYLRRWHAPLNHRLFT